MTIRGIPDATRDRIAEKASDAGQSMQEYVLGVLRREADRPDVARLLGQQRALLAEHGSSVTTDSVLESLRADRR